MAYLGKAPFEDEKRLEEEKQIARKNIESLLPIRSTKQVVRENSMLTKEKVMKPRYEDLEETKRTLSLNDVLNNPTMCVDAKKWVMSKFLSSGNPSTPLNWDETVYSVLPQEWLKWLIDAEYLKFKDSGTKYELYNTKDPGQEMAPNTVYFFLEKGKSDNGKDVIYLKTQSRKGVHYLLWIHPDKPAHRPYHITEELLILKNSKLAID